MRKSSSFHLNISFLSILVEIIELTNCRAPHFAKKLGVQMPWNVGLDRTDAQNASLNVINQELYDQYEKYDNKSYAFAACSNNSDCPWVFDENCDGIGPFLIGFRAKKIFECSKSGNGKEFNYDCNDDCLFEKVTKCEQAYDGVCSIPYALQSWIPAWTLSLFREDCIAHDFCYACGDFMDKERDQCDEDFFQMMLNSCKKSDSYDKSTCIYWASGYFDAVSSYGSAHFDGRRDCCNQTVKLQVDVDGVWSEWSSWNRCSADCGGGSQRRFHTCSNPPPSRYGLSCPGISRLSQNLTRSTNATINDMDRDYLGVEKDSYLEPTTPVFEIRACNEMPCIP